MSMSSRTFTWHSLNSLYSAGTLIDSEIEKLNDQMNALLEHFNDVINAQNERIDKLELELSQAEADLRGMSATISMKIYGEPMDNYT